MIINNNYYGGTPGKCKVGGRKVPRASKRLHQHDRHDINEQGWVHHRKRQKITYTSMNGNGCIFKKTSKNVQKRPSETAPSP